MRLWINQSIWRILLVKLWLSKKNDYTYEAIWRIWPLYFFENNEGTAKLGIRRFTSSVRKICAGVGGQR